MWGEPWKVIWDQVLKVSSISQQIFSLLLFDFPREFQQR